MKCKNKVMFIGFGVVLLWVLVVVFVCGVSESFGVIGGVVMIYMVVFVFLLFLIGFFDLS